MLTIVGPTRICFCVRASWQQGLWNLQKYYLHIVSPVTRNCRWWIKVSLNSRLPPKFCGLKHPWWPWILLFPHQGLSFYRHLGPLSKGESRWAFNSWIPAVSFLPPVGISILLIRVLRTVMPGTRTYVILGNQQPTPRLGLSYPIN